MGVAPAVGNFAHLFILSLWVQRQKSAAPVRRPLDLLVVRCHGIIEQFFYLSKHSYRKLDFQRFGNTLEQFEAPFP